MAIGREYFDEFNRHLLEDQKPSEYFNQLEAKGVFDSDYPFTLLGEFRKTEQNPTHHPEGNVWNHTMLVVNNAAQVKEQSSDQRVFMWSALLHDIGKPATTQLRKGRITSYDHDKTGERLSKDFLRFFTQDEEFILKVTKMVRWHMQILMVIKNLPFANIRTMVKEVPLHEIALLGMCDRLGRGEITEELLENEKKNMKHFIEKCSRFVKH